MEGANGFLLAAVIVLAVALAWRIVVSLRRRAVERAVLEASREMLDGNFEARAPWQAPGRIGEIARAVNRIAGESGDRMEQLRNESGELEALIAAMQEAVLALDAEGRMLRVNQSAMKMFGFSGDPHGVKLWEAVRHPGLEEKVAPALREGRPIRVSVPVGNRTVEGGLVPTGVGAGAVLVARDVTEERRYDELRTEFVANVSHELRTPLTLISGYVETLRGGALKDEKKGPEFLEVVGDNVGRLSVLVEELLDLSQLESGPLPAAFRQVRVFDVVDRVVATFRPLAEKKGQVLEVAPAEEAGEVRGDPDLLERALSNLVDNAVKYTPEKGTVRVKVASDSAAVRIAVEDTGVGIPEADLGRVFERFYRVDKSRSREMGGTGLGLAIVKHVAQIHGGEVTVESRPGSGSTFTLKLPRT